MALAVPRALISAVLQSHPSHRKPTGAYLVMRDGLDNHWHLLPQLQDHPTLLNKEDLCRFFVVAWAIHSNLILAIHSNLIYRAEDKNNNRVNYRLMGQFRRFLNDACLKEVNLDGWLLTWSNERRYPTLERIDHTFVSCEWDELFSQHDHHSLASICSDHAPMLLRTARMFFYYKCFPGFMEPIQCAWNCPLRDIVTP
jgi:hypothetical protein